jgi:hypothetical protein
MPGPNQATTYSFKDLSGGFNDPLAGPFAFAGQIGAGRYSVEMSDDRTASDLAADGLVLPSSMPGKRGHVNMEMQQTSPLHRFLLGWANQLMTAYDNGDVSDWYQASLALINKVDGSTHNCTGVCFTKIPTKTYGPQAERITWSLFCCNIENS